MPDTEQWHMPLYLVQAPLLAALELISLRNLCFILMKLIEAMVAHQRWLPFHGKLGSSRMAVLLSA